MLYALCDDELIVGVNPRLMELCSFRRALGQGVKGSYCAMYNLTQGRYVAPFVILTLQGLTLELKEGNNGRVHHGTTIQAGVFTIHL